jgi:hypothetical protein
MLPQLTMTTNQSQRRMGELTKPENTVYDILEEISQSGYAFRVVTIGKGAILESTVNCLGPVIRLTQSPSTGTLLISWTEELEVMMVHGTPPHSALPIQSYVSSLTKDDFSSIFFLLSRGKLTDFSIRGSIL